MSVHLYPLLLIIRVGSYIFKIYELDSISWLGEWVKTGAVKSEVSRCKSISVVPFVFSLYCHSLLWWSAHALEHFSHFLDLLWVVAHHFLCHLHTRLHRS